MLRYIFSAIAILLISTMLWLGIKGYQFFHSPLLASGPERTIKVYPNDHVSQVAKRLSEENIIHNPQLFILLADVTGKRHSLRYGEYRISSYMTMWQLLKNMSIGKGLVQHRITLVNGWRFKDFRLALQSHQTLKQTFGKATDHQVMKEISGLHKNPEGWFYPDTYFFKWGYDDRSILKRAHQKMKQVLADLWQQRASGLPYQTPYEALIAASLIQRETSLAEEKPLVASVIINRLKKGMRLQIDPTVQYGLKKTFGSDISKQDLKTKTSYNTYVIKGLPPTPICMPDRLSIEAALNPAKTKYLYYVATGSGGHRFSNTYLQHKKAVKAYRRYEKDMQQDVQQMEVWLQKGLSVVSRAIILMIYWSV